ncbi:hypothetical protein T310_6923, partial [Rasamsonia emersonii CBS 393.64]
RAVAFYVASKEGDDANLDKRDYYLPPIYNVTPEKANVDKRAVAFYVASKEGDDENLDKRAVAFYVAPKEGANAEEDREDFYIPPPDVTGPHGQKRSIPIYYFNPPDKRESTDGQVARV